MLMTSYTSSSMVVFVNKYKETRCDGEGCGQQRLKGCARGTSRKESYPCEGD